MDFRHTTRFLFGRALLIALAVFGTVVTARAQVNITADNNYALFYRHWSGTLTFVGAAACTTGACIFGAEQYPAPGPGREIYVVAWSDNLAMQGLIVEIVGAAPQPVWEVYGTKATFNGNPNSISFANDLINHINTADANSAWAAPVIGHANSTAGGLYPVVAGMGANARWMWLQSGKPSCAGPDSPFAPFCNHDEYLIFRLRKPKPPCAAVSFSSNCCLWGGFKKGTGTYAFGLIVDNMTGGSATLSLTPSQGTLSSFSPQTLPPGATLVSGTIAAASGANVCLLVTVQGNGKQCSFPHCFKTVPQCPAGPPPEKADDPIKIEVELTPEPPRIEPARPKPLASPTKKPWRE